MRVDFVGKGARGASDVQPEGSSTKPRRWNQVYAPCVRLWAAQCMLRRGIGSARALPAAAGMRAGPRWSALPVELAGRRGATRWAVAGLRALLGLTRAGRPSEMRSEDAWMRGCWTAWMLLECVDATALALVQSASKCVLCGACAPAAASAERSAAATPPSRRVRSSWGARVMNALVTGP